MDEHDLHCVREVCHSPRACDEADRCLANIHLKRPNAEVQLREGGATIKEEPSKDSSLPK